jgi:alpha-amylase/alpha-mannosidase (GH57 family)
MIAWAPVFHFYQPPTQFPAVLKKICQESYRPLIDLLGEFERGRATVNINGSLTQMLLDCGAEDVVSGLRRLAEGGRIELLGSAMYHPILPLIPEREIVRQIELNHATNRRAFGDIYTPRGFFPPELAYDGTVAMAALKTGHRWILTSGIACATDWPVDVVHRIDGYPDLAVLFRDDIVSNRISFRNIDGFGFIDHLRSLGGADSSTYVVTAMDAETFGHHVTNWERLFLAHVYAQFASELERVELGIPQRVNLAAQHRQILADSAPRGRELRVVTATELLGLFPAGATTTPRPSSWSTSSEDLTRDVPYPLWKDPSNHVQALLWRHLHVCLELVDLATRATAQEGRPYADIARGLLDRALHSCQFWWASRRPMWDLNMVERGLAEQRAVVLNAMKALTMSKVPGADRETAEDRCAVADDLGRRVRRHLLAA